VVDGQGDASYDSSIFVEKVSNVTHIHDSPSKNVLFTINVTNMLNKVLDKP
jgi:hypothetical protein